MSKVKSIGKRILIELAAPETVTAGGIIIPESAKDPKANKGKVVSVGEEVTNIKVNDSVFFNKFTGAEIEHEGYKYLTLKQEDIYAVFK